MKPPQPPSEHKLLLQWNSDFPPAHGETVVYVCDAGNKHNRFESNFNKWNMTLECLVDNQFKDEPNVTWPTCINGINFILVSKAKLCLSTYYYRCSMSKPLEPDN